ncbi:MAG TPA: lipid-binding SYLF domain-containing protein [Desulfuromonadales bacterium]|nr:lipid-binding SYLF domain-containing protein [Desulfuromonadales bacterium]
MKNVIRTIVLLLLSVQAAAVMIAPHPAEAAVAAEINRDALAALDKLYASTPKAKMLGEKAKAILVFPSILKAGLIIGGQGGNGALVEKGKIVANYNISAVTYGFQAGAQEFSYAMFLMTSDALKFIDKNGGWEVGVGPNIVVVDEGAAKSLTTTTTKDDVYTFIFSQKGLMAGVGVEGSKITKIKPD